MKPLVITICSAALCGATLVPGIARANDDLDVTMEVIDDLSELDGELVILEAPEEEDYEEDVFDLDGDGIPDDQEDDTGLFEEFSDVEDADFDIEGENDGFEHDNDELLAEEEFESEDEFEAGEDVDDDEFDEIEDEMEDDGMEEGEPATE